MTFALHAHFKTDNRQVVGVKLKSRGGGGESHMKGAGMLVVSLRGVNCGLWSHLGCSGQTAIMFSLEGLV